MGRSPCCDENGLKKGPWTPEEDQKLIDYIQKHGHGSWRALPKLAGLNRCGKSCRLRWTNYLRPDIKRGKFTEEEEQTILRLHSILGNKWSAIATHLAGRTDNEIKNFWNTHLKKKLIQMGCDPITHRPRTDLFASLPNLIGIALAGLLEQHQLEEHAARLQSEALELAKIQYLQCLLQSNSSSMITTTSSSSNSQFHSANLDHDLSIPQMREISTSTPSLQVSDFENHATFSLGNPTATTSQLLHHLITSNNPMVLNPQIPFDFQTHFNTSYDNVRQNMIPDDHSTMVTPGTLLPSPASSTLPPLTETSTSNVGDDSSTFSNGEGASNYWSELLFDAAYMHEIS